MIICWGTLDLDIHVDAKLLDPSIQAPLEIKHTAQGMNMGGTSGSKKDHRKARDQGSPPKHCTAAMTDVIHVIGQWLLFDPSHSASRGQQTTNLRPTWAPFALCKDQMFALWYMPESYFKNK